MATRHNLKLEVSSKILSELRKIAQEEGRQLQEVVEEALVELIAKRREPRPHVTASYQASHEQFGRLYKKLAE